MHTKVNKEAVRILVQSVGYTEAANQTGIDRNTLYQWNRRYAWNVPVVHSQEKRVRTVRSPADAHAAVLQDRKEQSAGYLSKYAVNASEDAAKLNGKARLKQAQNVRHVAAVREHLWPQEKQQQTNVMVNIALLGVQPSEITVQDVSETGSV